MSERGNNTVNIWFCNTLGLNKLKIKRVINVDRLYPKTRFSDEATPEEQFRHIISEFNEALTAKSLEERDRELADLEHSIETYFDIREKQGIDIDQVRREVMNKNHKRGYYYD